MIVQTLEIHGGTDRLGQPEPVGSLRVRFGPPLDTASTPLDINRRMDSGELASGLLIPAFACSFRGDGARMIWPTSGALAVPLVACIGRGAPDVAHELLASLLTPWVQERLNFNGSVVPVRQDTPAFPGLEASGWDVVLAERSNAAAG